MKAIFTMLLFGTAFLSAQSPTNRVHTIYVNELHFPNNPDFDGVVRSKLISSLAQYCGSDCTVKETVDGEGDIADAVLTGTVIVQSPDARHYKVQGAMRLVDKDGAVLWAATVYNKAAGLQGSGPEPPYAKMSLDQIAGLPVSDLAANDAHLYLWTTGLFLPHAFALLEGWGFRYKQFLTWIKPNSVITSHFHSTTEPILFGVKGSLPLLRGGVPSHFFGDRPRQHSAKPDEFYRIVETCSPGPWIEMFARRSRPGWICWGAEVGKASSFLHPQRPS